MRREVGTRMLVDMIEAIVAGTLPVPVKAFYVFGSYARGAVAPHDLDILVVYKNPDKAYWDVLDAEMRSRGR
jgi:predicted nucleotidyltransferase